MRRNLDCSHLPLPERTTTALRDEEREDHFEWLYDVPTLTPFGEDAAQGLETMWAYSCYAEEEQIAAQRSGRPPRQRKLHSLPDLYTLLVGHLAMDALLMGEPEWDMLTDLLESSGPLVLADDEQDPVSAVSLVRRLWVSVRTDEATGHLEYTLARELAIALRTLVQLPEFPALRDSVQQLYYALMNALSIHGIITEDTVVHWMEGRLRKPLRTFCSDAFDGLCRRALRAAFCWCLGHDGRVFLVHPGVTEPGRFLSGAYEGPLDMFILTEEGVPMENLLFSEAEFTGAFALARQIARTIRPECNPFDVINDLRMMIRCGASADELTEVLASALTVRPNAIMREAVSNLRFTLPAFSCVRARMVQ